MISSFEILLPLMQPGGIYVIEYLAFHFIPKGSGVMPYNRLFTFPVSRYSHTLHGC